jgi:hypothetical protein
MPDGDGDVAHPPRQNRLLACLRAHLFHPKTKREKILCWLFWICLGTGVILALVVALPKFFTNIVKPFLAYCEVPSHIEVFLPCYALRISFALSGKDT